MTKMFSKDFEQESTTIKSKNIIRNEIKSHFHAGKYGIRGSLDAMKIEADAFNCGDISKYKHSDYQKGAELVDAGYFARFYTDERKMLEKIYGKDNVENWNGNKIHSTYKHLIGREYDAMLREREKR